jgi:hypothetical protein
MYQICALRKEHKERRNSCLYWLHYATALTMQRSEQLANKRINLADEGAEESTSTKIQHLKTNTVVAGKEKLWESCG